MESRSRIRENQRRSRARRKEYLQELEQRVREAERQGVQASVEVQAAARRVAEENQKLRQLLRYHGVSDECIQGYLDSAVDLSDARGVGAPPSSGSANKASQRFGHLLTPQALPGATSAAISPRRSPPPETRPSHSENDNSAASSAPSSSSPSADEANCSMAADLISTMTGMNPHEVRTTLGCAPGTDCHVDHNKIGDAIAQFTDVGTAT